MSVRHLAMMLAVDTLSGRAWKRVNVSTVKFDVPISSAAASAARRPVRFVTWSSTPSPTFSRELAAHPPPTSSVRISCAETKHWPSRVLL